MNIGILTFWQTKDNYGQMLAFMPNPLNKEAASLSAFQPSSSANFSSNSETFKPSSSVKSVFASELKDESQEITIDNFASLIDPQSWEEFMPKGVTKQKFI